MFKHFKSFVLFYVATERLRIGSCYDMQQARSRLMDLREHGLRVREKHDGHLTIASGHHGPRANIVPIFTGTLAQEGENVTLNGEIGIDTGIRIAIALIAVCILCLLCFGKATFPGAGWLGMLVFVGLLEFGYFNGRRDPVAIIQSLRNALDSTITSNPSTNPSR